MSWFRRKQDKRLDEALRLLGEEQRLNRVLVLVVEEQTGVIRQLIDQRPRYPQTVGIKVTA